MLFYPVLLSRFMFTVTRKCKAASMFTPVFPEYSARAV